MLAKAVATEGGASFLSVDASSVENKWLGESEKNAKAVFTLARRLAPCVTKWILCCLVGREALMTQHMEH
jgi:SpoVK/Ycf46/Vps4 family AAA+-type ATPase